MLARPLIRSVSAGKLTVLAFHKVPRQAHPLVSGELDLARFETILAAVQESFTVMPLPDAVRALRAGRLPRGSACITFDDGYPEWVDGVVPVLKRNNVHATFFITTGQLHGVPLWNERILHAVDQAPTDTPDFQFEGLATAPLRFASDKLKGQAVAWVDNVLKYLPVEERHRHVEALERHTGSVLSDVPVMSWADARAIESQGFGIGGHSVLHPILSLTSPEEALHELVCSRETLEQGLRCKVPAFAYPNGVAQRDIGFVHTQLAQRAGYQLAVTTERGVANERTSLFQIPRFTPWGPSSNRMNAQLLRNFWHPVRYLHNPAPPRHALMIAFHFPPQAGSSGILRTLNFTKYLPRSGWQPIVVSACPKAYEQVRNDLVDSIPPEVGVVRGFALDAARHLSVRGKYLDLFAIPDRWSSWWLGACWLALREVRRQRPALVWSTYPISTAHLIGLTVSRLSGLPWVADFRDPMLSEGYPEPGLKRRIWQWIEAATLRRAQRCVFTTERAAQVYRERYPAQARKCLVIENGYDEEAFEGNAPQRIGVPEGGILMLHSGIIYPQERDPSAFFAAVRSWLEAGGADPAKLVIRFRAPHHGEDVSRLAAKFGLSANVDIAPPVPYQSAIAEMLGADLLLVFQGSSFNAQVPAKIYEYLRTGNALLGLVDPAGDTAAKMHQFKRVFLADIHSSPAICSALVQWALARGSASSERDAAHNIQAIQTNSRLIQATRLASVLDACCIDSPLRRKARGSA
jgi:peptidoglycan/xylan/chitin deacetylase (PgdA/CDA1 family)/glycosyltransferase involved in cell wall biosynthesis